jgi:hypothetical protein
MHGLYGDGSAATAYGTSQPYIAIRSSIADTANSNTNAFAAAIIDIHDCGSTTRNKTVRYLSGFDKNLSNTSYRVELGSGSWPSTAAITSITLTGDVDFASGSTFALYGIKAGA